VSLPDPVAQEGTRGAAPDRPDFRLGYRPELDGLRGVAILLVLVHHLHHEILPGGFLGVDVFFVLSGYLITSLLLQEWSRSGTISLRRFYARRALRLLPALALIVLALGAFAALFLDPWHAGMTWQGIWLTLSHVSNWFYALSSFSADNPLGTTWSLAIEEQFYLLWPTVLCVSLSRGLGRKALVAGGAALILAVACHRAVLVHLDVPVKRLYYASDTRADALLVGCVVAFLTWWGMVPRGASMRLLLRGLAACGFLYIGTKALTATWLDLLVHGGFAFTLVALATASILLMLVECPTDLSSRLLGLRPLVWIGRISYGLYLWHWPVRWFVYEQQALPRGPLQLLLALLLAVGLAALSFHLVERRFLRWKIRFQSPGARAPGAGAEGGDHPVGGSAAAKSSVMQ
jgi:peptidoglycan/LPS O-acetylase OafA/YrhL